MAALHRSWASGVGDWLKAALGRLVNGTLELLDRAVTAYVPPEALELDDEELLALYYLFEW